LYNYGKKKLIILHTHFRNLLKKWKHEENINIYSLYSPKTINCFSDLNYLQKSRLGQVNVLPGYFELWYFLLKASWIDWKNTL
jgi:hypothetical protein